MFALLVILRMVLSFVIGLAGGVLLANLIVRMHEYLKVRGASAYVKLLLTILAYVFGIALILVISVTLGMGVSAIFEAL